MYRDLIECFEDEFEGILQIKVVDDPSTLAAEGYCIHSVEISGAGNKTAVGLDVGNAQTVLTVKPVTVNLFPQGTTNEMMHSLMGDSSAKILQ